MKDVVFLKYQEPNWEENLNIVKSILGDVFNIIVVDGENDLLKTYEKIFSIDELSDIFIMIEGDNLLLENAKEILENIDYPSIFQTNNDFGIVSTHGAIKILNKSLKNKLPTFSYDTTINFRLPLISTVLSYHKFNWSPHNSYVVISKELLKAYFWGNYHIIDLWCNNILVKKIWESLEDIINTVSLHDLRDTILNKNKALSKNFYKTKKIHVACICKNEQELIKDFINHIKSADYIYILDTGSTDNTIKLIYESINEFNIKNKTILKTNNYYPKIDFSQFRNDLIGIIPAWTDNDVLVILDIDERFDSENWYSILLEECFNSYNNSFYINREDSTKLFNVDLLRIFKSISGKWVGRLHEGFELFEQMNISKIEKLKISHLTSELNRTDNK